MILTIDVSDPAKVKLSLDGNRHVFQSARLSEQLLPEIKKFLQKNKIKFNQLREIFVRQDPSHFSRTRTAVAVANGLAFALNLPQESLKPVYDRAPNITLSKS